MRTLLTTCLLLFTVAGTPHAQTGTPEQQLRVRIQQLEVAADSAEFYLPDAVFWSGAYSRPHLRNAPDREFETDFLGAPNRRNEQTKLTIERLTLSGDMASEFSRFVLTFDDDSGHRTVEGALLRVWQRQNGVWRVAAIFQRPYGRVAPPQSNAPGR